MKGGLDRKLWAYNFIERAGGAGVGQAYWRDAWNNAWGPAGRVLLPQPCQSGGVRRSSLLPRHLPLDPTKGLSGPWNATAAETTTTALLASRNSQKQQGDALGLEL